MLKPGTILLDKYRVERPLGVGGVGIVVLATHLQLDEPMAIKLLQPVALNNAEVEARFLREARAAAKLKTEHICRVYDVGLLNSGEPYMVMEYLDGKDLGDVLLHAGPPEIPQATDLIQQACEALAEAHSNGIVHRDIKPANLFLTRRPDGSPLLKLLDFGISKASLQIDMGLTGTDATLGTPAYMSPEQLRSSKQVDHRTDIWSLGVVLHELLCGRRPYDADTFAAICLKAATDPVPPIGIDLPKGLESVVLRCLHKDPNLRFQTVADLSLALEPFTDHGGRKYVRRPPPVFRALAKTAVYPPGQIPGFSPAARAKPSTLTATASELATTGALEPQARRWMFGGVTFLLVAGLLGWLTSNDDEVALSIPGAMTLNEPIDAGSPRDSQTQLSDSDTASDAALAHTELVQPDAPPEQTDPRGPEYFLESIPNGVRIERAGKPVGKTPYRFRLPAGESAKFTLTKRGRSPATVTFPQDADADRTAVVHLKSLSSPPVQRLKKRKKSSSKSRRRKTRNSSKQHDTLPW